MGKYASYVKPDPANKVLDKPVHPLWRGIGFILMIVVPVLSYLASLEILRQNATMNWFPIPTDILSPWGGDSLIFVKIFIAFVLIVIVFAILMVVRFASNILFGPPRYGPLDSPPIRKGEKYR